MNTPRQNAQTSLREIVLTVERTVVRTLLPEATKKRYAQGDLRHKELRPYADAILELSQEYVQHSAKAISTVHAHAYALYYLPINLAKAVHLLQKIPPAAITGAVLDFGAGPGTLSLAARFLFPHLTHIDIVEQSDEMSCVASELHQACTEGTRCTQSIYREIPADKSYALILVGNALNELSAPTRKSVEEALVAALAPGSYLVLLEPALLQATRLLMETRDSIVMRHEDLSILFPCTHTEPCPMKMKEPENWCHGSLSWEGTPLVAQLDELTGFNKHRIKFASVIMHRGQHEKEANAYRIVAPVDNNRTGTSATICGAHYYGPIKLRKRDRSDANRVLLRAELYDEIVTDRAITTENIAEDLTVSLKRS
jgi:ribosomal protein RSM22 (predicted rRNA methylase)